MVIYLSFVPWYHKTLINQLVYIYMLSLSSATFCRCCQKHISQHWLITTYQLQSYSITPRSIYINLARLSDRSAWSNWHLCRGINGIIHKRWDSNWHSCCSIYDVIHKLWDSVHARILADYLVQRGHLTLAMMIINIEPALEWHNHMLANWCHRTYIQLYTIVLKGLGLLDWFKQ